MSMRLLPVLVTNSNPPSANTWIVAPEGIFNFCKAAIPSKTLVTFSEHFSVTMMLGVFGFACLSTFKGVHKDWLETRKENREDRGKQFSCQCGENV